MSLNHAGTPVDFPIQFGVVYKFAGVMGFVHLECNYIASGSMCDVTGRQLLDAVSTETFHEIMGFENYLCNLHKHMYIHITLLNIYNYIYCTYNTVYNNYLCYIY